MNVKSINITLLLLCVTAAVFLSLALLSVKQDGENAKTVSLSASYSSENVAALTLSRDRLLTRLEKLKSQPPKQKEYNTAKMRETCVKNMIRLENEALAGIRKIAYITIDDGPYESRNADFLNILKEKDVRATFFVTGKPDLKDLYCNVLKEGHMLANHSYTHALKGEKYTDRAAFIEDINKLDSLVFGFTGIHTEVVRFPGGSAQAKELKDELISDLKQSGYSYVDWNCATMDGFSAPITAEQAYSNAVSQAKKYTLAVMLMHEYNQSSLEALPKIIDELRREGYIFLPLFKESSAVK